MCQPPGVALRFSAFSEFESQTSLCIGAIDVAGEIQGKTMLVSRAVLVFESSPEFMEKKKIGQAFLQVGGAPPPLPRDIKEIEMEWVSCSFSSSEGGRGEAGVSSVWLCLEHLLLDYHWSVHQVLLRLPLRCYF